jgi:hypothetical protein
MVESTLFDHLLKDEKTIELERSLSKSVGGMQVMFEYLPPIKVVQMQSLSKKFYDFLVPQFLQKVPIDNYEIFYFANKGRVLMQAQLNAPTLIPERQK